MNTTTVIPKADLTACERWTPDTLDPSSTDIQASADGTEAETSDQNIHTPTTQEELESLLQEAMENGHKQGYEAGYKNGFQECEQQNASKITAITDQINTILTNLNQHAQSIEQHVAQDLLTLAIDLTKKMLTQALTIHPELILPIVQDAIRHLPYSKQRLHLFLNPEDATVVRQYLSEQPQKENWEIHEDAQLTVGGCRLETDGSEIDASVETRWRQVMAAIGQQNDWIEK